MRARRHSSARVRAALKFPHQRSPEPGLPCNLITLRQRHELARLSRWINTEPNLLIKLSPTQFTLRPKIQPRPTPIVEEQGQRLFRRAKHAYFYGDRFRICAENLTR